jgi:hypothetical protein
MERRPDAMWRTGTQWSFRNEAKVYGSPMLDSAWLTVSSTSAGEVDPLPGVLAELKAADVPMKPPAGGSGGGRARGSRAKGKGKRMAGDALEDGEGELEDDAMQA